MKITVGIATFSRPKNLLETVQQLIDSQISKIEEIIIADQTPWNQLEIEWQKKIEYIKTIPKVKYHTLMVPNLPAARNFIISKSIGDLIIWIDDDVILPPDFIDQHQNSYVQNPNIIALAGNPYHRIIEVSDESTIDLENYHLYCSKHFNHDFFVLNWKFTMIGANHSVLKKYAIDVHGYDENILGGYAEDTDFTYRLQKMFPDKFISFNPEAWLIHLRSKRGGCRIEKNNKWSEYATIIGPQICRVRHKRNFSIYSILRMSPLRRENILKPWRQFKSWFAFFKSLANAHILKNKVKSPFIN